MAGTFLKNRIIQSGEAGVVVPGGTTAERPANPVFGVFRYNTSSNNLEFFNGSQYTAIANSGEANITVDSFTGDNSTLTFTLSTAASAYTITGSGNDITFSSAPLAAEPINVIHGVGNTP
jgi:hypothetical protein